MNYSEIMQIELQPHQTKVIRETPIGPMEDFVDHKQWMVMVCGDKVQQVNGTPKLLVGYIGTQAGANFCPLSAYYRFVSGQRDYIVSEAKRLHGNASPLPPTDVPPPNMP